MKKSKNDSSVDNIAHMHFTYNSVDALNRNDKLFYANKMQKHFRIWLRVNTMTIIA